MRNRGASSEIGAERVGPVYIRAAQISTFTSLVGIVISSVLAPIGLNLPILLGGSLFVVLSIVLALIMPEKHFTPGALFSTTHGPYPTYWREHGVPETHPAYYSEHQCLLRPLH